MPADRAMDRRKDPLSGNAILGCVPPNDKPKVGAALITLRIKASYGFWSSASSHQMRFQGMWGMVSQDELAYKGDHRMVWRVVNFIAATQLV